MEPGREHNFHDAEEDMAERLADVTGDFKTHRTRANKWVEPPGLTKGRESLLQAVRMKKKRRESKTVDGRRNSRYRCACFGPVSEFVQSYINWWPLVELSKETGGKV